MLYYIPQFKTTTLSTPGGIDAVTVSGIKLADVSGVDITKPGILCVTYTNPLDTDNAEFISYSSIDGSNTLISPVRAQEGISAKTHANGALIGFVVSKSHLNNINDLLTGIIEGIRVKTSIQDENGNEVIKTPPTVSAVNEITVANAATGGSPIISATGGDTNVGLEIKGKGTGNIEISPQSTGVFKVKTTVQLSSFGVTSDQGTGDGKAGFEVPSELDGFNLVAVRYTVDTAGTTGTSDVQIRRVRSGTPADMLSTKLTIDSTELSSATAATPAVINTTYDDIVTGDMIYVDQDAIQTTKAKGGHISLTFAKP